MELKEHLFIVLENQRFKLGIVAVICNPNTRKWRHKGSRPTSYTASM